MSGSSTIALNGPALGTSLEQLLMCDEIVPGSDVSYQTCKAIYLWHPVGGKMAEAPIQIAQSQKREITVPKGPEERVRKAFQAEWDKLGADRHIFNTMRTSRIYGIGTIIVGALGVDTDKPIDPFDLPDLKLYFNILDPLNTSGSLVLNQQPNSPDFQKVTNVSVQGDVYHRSRAVVIMNDSPIYIAYTTSAFGYVGRSVYQRALYSLKSYIQVMIADAMVARKAGVLVAKMRPPGSIVDRLMQNMAGIKRSLLQQAKTDNVIGITPEEDIASLNLQNIDGALNMARDHIVENIAVASDMPSKLLSEEAFVSGFSEGTEDAHRIAQYVDRVREQMRPLYMFFDKIVQHRAWNKEFYKIIQKEFPDEYGKKSYEEAFYEWQNSFEAVWPSLLIEPDSEKSKTEDVRLKSIVAVVETWTPTLDPENKVRLMQWATDNINNQEVLFSTPMTLDWDALRNYTPPDSQAEGTGIEQEPKEPKPFAATA